MDKQELRREIRAKRRAMDLGEWSARSGRVCQRIRSLREYEEAKTVYAYLAVRGEVLLDELIADAWRQGKQVAVPKVLGREMAFYRLQSLEAVEPGSLGIREPIDTEPAKGEGPVLFLMPGMAFDRELNRVGQGGGYYDRYLERYRMPFKLGAAFDFQMYPSVPAGELDVKVDGIVTESRIYMPQGRTDMS